MTYSKLAVLALTVPLLTGCGNQVQVPVNVVADNYCQAARKRTWSVNDTPETIQEAIRHNAGIDRACGKKGTS